VTLARGDGAKVARVTEGERYWLMIAGRPGRRILAAMPGFELVAFEDGHARLEGSVRDQAELQEVLRSLADLGVAIDGLHRVE
jgi:hypothetical protein